MSDNTGKTGFFPENPVYNWSDMLTGIFQVQFILSFVWETILDYNFHLGLKTKSDFIQKVLLSKEFFHMSTQNKKTFARLELNKENLLGPWHLSAYEGRADDGSISYPFTETPQGMLTYNADGTMMVIIMKPDRPLFESNDFSTGSDAEIRAAYEGFLAYCGRFVLDVKAGTVTHFPEQAHFPNWIGAPLMRFASLMEGQLSLSTPPTLSDGKVRRFYLIWKR